MVIGKAERVARVLDTGIGNALVLTIERARHGREIGALEIGFRRQVEAGYAGGFLDHILRWGGLVVGHVVDARFVSIAQRMAPTTSSR